MRRTIASAVEIVVAIAAIVAAVWSWHHGLRTSTFAAEVHGAPDTTGTLYQGPWIALAFVLVAIAGVLVIDAVRRRRADMPE